MVISDTLWFRHMYMYTYCTMFIAATGISAPYWSFLTNLLEPYFIMFSAKIAEFYGHGLYDPLFTNLYRTDEIHVAFWSLINYNFIHVLQKWISLFILAHHIKTVVQWPLIVLTQNISTDNFQQNCKQHHVCFKVFPRTYQILF